MIRSTLHLGDCREYAKSMKANSVDAIITDPPYHLTSIVKRFGKEGSAPCQEGTDGVYKRHSTGFMGKQWDGGDIAQDPATWAEFLRIAKPGAHLLAFGGTRTFHRMMVAIEDAGWEIRDTLMWIHGQGFPKSHDVSKAIDKKAGAEREKIGEKEFHGHNAGSGAGSFSKNQYEGQTGIKRTEPITAPSTPEAQQWEGWGSALKPAWEPIVLARKPLEGSIAENVLKMGTGAINIDGCRVPSDPVPINKLEKWSGFGQEKQPDYEQEINNKGRWPSNVIHDGSEEVTELFPHGISRPRTVAGRRTNGNHEYGFKSDAYSPHNDSGSAARFYYCAKASKQDREEGLEDLEDKLYVQSGGDQGALARGANAYQEGEEVSFGMNKVKVVKNNHPTVKPTELMKYLCRFVTPPNGIIFDPFMGSGSTGKAAILEGFQFIGCDTEAEYVEIAKRRIEWAEKQPRQPKLGI